MINTTIPQSGISNLLGRYPIYRQLANVPDICGMLCYIQQHPGPAIASVSISRVPSNNDVDIAMTFWDASDTAIDLSLDNDITNTCILVIEKHSMHLVEIMKTIRLFKVQIYFTQDIVITDVRLDDKKLAGPGMMKDLLGTSIKIPKTLSIKTIDQDTRNQLIQHPDMFGCDIIIKPSRFRIDNNGQPLYAEIVNR